MVTVISREEGEHTPNVVCMYCQSLKAKLPQILLLTAILLVSTSAAFLPSAHSASRPRINSQWTSNPPTIDGKFSAGEWFNLQITMAQPDYPINAFAYFLNDNSKLYILVDAIGDTTDDSGDECYLLFNFDSQISVFTEGKGGLAKMNGYVGAIGFGSSPNSGANHKIFEFGVPLSFLKMVAGQSIDLSSPAAPLKPSIVFDESTGKDNIYPNNLVVSDLNTWALLFTQTRPAPVGGVLVSVNKLGIIAPYIALAGLVAVLSAIVVVRRKSA